MFLNRRDFLKTQQPRRPGSAPTRAAFLGRTAAAAAPPTASRGRRTRSSSSSSSPAATTGSTPSSRSRTREYAKLPADAQAARRSRFKQAQRRDRPAPGARRPGRRCSKTRPLCVVQGVGYPNPSQSHFRSMDIWQAASTAETLTEGWIGKALRQMPRAVVPPRRGNESAPLALTGAPVRVPSITSLEDFQLTIAAASGADNKAQRAVIEGAVKSGSRGSREPARLRAADRRQHLRQQPAAGRRSARTTSRRSPYPADGAGQPPATGRPAHRRRPGRPHLLRLHRRLRHARRPGAGAREPAAAKCPTR